jgi:hypothetical protein
MKISGPGQPAAPGAEGVGKEGVGKSEGVGAAGTPADTTASESGKAFADKLSGAAPATAAEPGRVARTGGGVTIQDLAADLDAGKLDSRAAVKVLIERIVDAQLGPGAPAKVREQVQAALRDAIEDDPLLATKLSQLD